MTHMYTQYFGLSEPPFSIAPNPRYLYMSEQHKEALAHLIYGMQNEGGVILLTGEIGTGKTTICRRLLEELPENTDIAFIINPKMSVVELLATICDEFGIRYPKRNNSIKVFTDGINSYLLDAHANGRHTVLIIDEAQNLSTDVLEQLRLLTNLETDEKKLLQIVLLGQPELQQMLARKDLRQLSQRITARYHLHALNKAEIHHYVRHRLAVAGVQKPLFTSLAFHKLSRLSKGIPRLINLLCDRALLGAYANERKQANQAMIRKAAREIFGSLESPESSPQVHVWTWAGVVLVLALAGSFLLPGKDADITAPWTTARSGNAKQETQIQAGAPKQEKIQEMVVSIPHESPFVSTELSTEESKTLAYQTLLHLWGMDITLQQGADHCQQTATLGLPCLSQISGLGRLRELNRPAVLKIATGNGIVYAVLTALDGKQATIRIGEESKTVLLEELELAWFNDYTLLWKAPPLYHGPIRPGATGPVVPWLAAQLDIVQGQMIPSRTFTRVDTVLTERIKAFQRSHGLNPDGVAGPQTLIRVNVASGIGGPKLMPEQAS